MKNITILCKNNKFTYKIDHQASEEYDMIDFDDFFAKLMDDVKPDLGVENFTFNTVNSFVEKNYCRFTLEQNGSISDNYKLLVIFNFTENKNIVEIIKNYVHIQLTISTYFDDDFHLLSLYKEFTRDFEQVKLSLMTAE